MVAYSDIHQQSRHLDFFSDAGLEGETELGATEWPAMIGSELAANGLDNCESAGIAPKIEVSILPSGITVRDNGTGLPHEAVIKPVATFKVRATANRHRRQPSRGQRGQALSTVFAVPYVLSESDYGRVVVETSEGTSTIIIENDAATNEPTPRVEFSTDTTVSGGTQVSVEFPEEAEWLLERAVARFRKIVTAFRFSNPHASFTLTTYETEYDDDGDWYPVENTETYEATNTGWIDQRWNPQSKISPLWYEEKELAAWVAAEVQTAERIGGDSPEYAKASDWLARFDISEAKRKGIANTLNLKRRTLRDMCDRFQTSGFRRDLLRELQENCKPTKPTRLGPVGKEHIAACMKQASANMDTFEYRSRPIDSIWDGKQCEYMIEVGFAELPEAHPAKRPANSRQIISAVNWAPCLNDCPFRFYEGGTHPNLDSLLEEMHLGSSRPVIIFIHLISARPGFVTNGKTSVRVTGQRADDMCDAVRLASQVWTKKCNEYEATLNRGRRAIKKREKIERKKEMNFKQALYLVIEEAVQNATGNGKYTETSQRFVYYAARKLVQQYTKKKLKQGTFNRVFQQYQEEHGPFDNVYKDARGFFMPPHSKGKQIPLGTKSVAEYTLPEHQFHTIILFEKKNFIPILRDSGLLEKYDVGVIAGEGFTVDAAKQLMERAAQSGSQLGPPIIFRDADAYGLSIFLKVKNATLRTGAIEAIDGGLDFEYCRDVLGLEPEEYERHQALDAELYDVMSDAERAAWEGIYDRTETKKGRGGKYQDVKYYTCQRIELNDLAKDPQMFLDYVETQLREHKYDKKLVPPEDDVVDYMRSKCREGLTDAITNVVAQMISDEVVTAVTSQLTDDIEEHSDFVGVYDSTSEWAATPQPRQWSSFLDGQAQSLMSTLDDDVESLSKEAILTVARRLAEGGET